MEGHRSEKLNDIRRRIEWATIAKQEMDPTMTAVRRVLAQRTKISSRISACLQIYKDHPDKVSSIRDDSPATSPRVQVAITKAEEIQRHLSSYNDSFSKLSESLKTDRRYLDSYLNRLERLVERVEKAKSREELDNIQIGIRSATVSDLRAIKAKVEEWKKLDLKDKVQEHYKALKLLVQGDTQSTTG